MPTSTKLDRQLHHTEEAQEATDCNRLHTLTNAGMLGAVRSQPRGIMVRLCVNSALIPPLKLVVEASSDRPFVKPIRHRKRQDFLPVSAMFPRTRR